ncbi:uncharacterized protein LOC142977295 [Anticarsia gemmatalis]|uniref:uncharacterized protein LOC142977295 n=1 Tax=Anticarsia gemmatalis TaxID=129554 RepID=UPI003F7660E2
MGIFPLEKCCCCISLKIGSYIVGFLELATSVLWLVALKMYWIEVQSSAMPSFMRSMLLLPLENILLGLGVLSFVFSILLLYAVHQHKSEQIKAYIIFATFSVTCVVIALAFTWDITSWIHGLCLVGIIVYRHICLLIVGSYYAKMDEPPQIPL